MAKKTFAFSIFLFVGVFTFAAQEKTVMVYSKAMDKNIETVIISPDDSNVRCSTIYMLHGFNGNARSWINIEPRLKEWSDKYYIVFVFPDGKRFWWVDSPVQNSIRYETFVSSELVNYIDTTYNTLAYPQQRAITGYSTGGSGAVRIAVKHPNVFSSAGSSSGIFDLLHINWVPVDISPRNDLNLSSVS